jgi:hypothetical protein
MREAETIELLLLLLLPCFLWGLNGGGLVTRPSYLEKRAQPFKEKKLSLEVGKYGTMHHIKASQLKSQQSFLG